METIRIDGGVIRTLLMGSVCGLRARIEEINDLNVFPVPDGDTGDNMTRTIESGVAAIEGMNTDNLAEAIRAFSRGMLLGARGNSGVILSQFFLGVACGLENVKAADAYTFAEALRVGVRHAYHAVVTPAEGTILTVAREAVEYAHKRLTPKSTIKTLFADLVNEISSIRFPNA